jgi:murein DD-endopeptidase MepM/ murein hydrolase activator NlpD
MGWPKWGRTALTWLGLPIGGLLAFAVAVTIPWDAAPLAPTALEATALHPQAALAALASRPAAPAAAQAEPAPTRSARLRSGETLGGLLGELGLPATDAYDVAEAARRYVDLRQLRPGTRWAAYYGDGGELTRFDLALEGRGDLRVERHAGRWQPALREYRRELRVRGVTGALDGSLEASIQRAGADGELAYAMADVLQWDLDFNRDLQTGDRFAILFEEVWLDGSYSGLGRILALTYGHEGGATWDAFRFGTDGYYDRDGRPLQKMFLRSPLPYARVTSRFSNRRFHPILKVFRPHYGVDLGAPVGTPVRVTASGTVVEAGWDGGGGRIVKVRHPNGYLTCYMHLSRFASGLRAGVRVSQGDVIAYVGSSGLSTAPHLDYRVQHNGKWIDPLAMTSVPAEPLSAARLAEFRVEEEAMRASLETGRPYPPPGAPRPLQVAGSGAPTVRARR